MATRSESVIGARRRLVLVAPAWLAGLALGVPAAARSGDRPATIAAMQAARDTETSVYTHYEAYGRKACAEGYRGVAYLFVAVAASERIHAANFARALERLGAAVAPAPKPGVEVRDTRDNLMRAAGGELHSIDTFYPELLGRIRAEGFEEAIRSVQWAWKSEQQHREKMQQILRWSPSFFGRVARTIDEKTGQYFVCGVCGSTTNAIPADRCAVCGEAPSGYRRIDPPDC